MTTISRFTTPSAALDEGATLAKAKDKRGVFDPGDEIVSREEAHGQLTCEQVEEVLSWCDSYQRMPAILELRCQMKWSDWFRLLGKEWSGCDNVGRFRAVFMPMFQMLQRQRLTPIREMMDAEAQASYDALPEVVTVYRGCYACNKWGLSWSLSADTAARFPTLWRYRQPGQPLLVEAQAKKANIVALVLDRDEAEIITVRPKHIATIALSLNSTLEERL